MCSLTERGNDHCPYIPMLFYRMCLEKTCEEAETGLKVLQAHFIPRDPAHQSHISFVLPDER
jgi:hypothetical protein